MRTLFFALPLSAAAVAAYAQPAYPPYPVRPVRVLVPVPAGGTIDVLARMIAPAMSQLLGQPLVIDNRGGAGGLIGTELASRAAPDGYTIMMCSQGPITILPHLRLNVPYDTLRDFAPVSLISTGPYLLLTQPTAPFKTVKELIAAARAAPGTINYGSAGNGAPNHLASELFKNMAGINLVHVPYKGAPQAFTDLLGGHLRLILGSIPPLLPHVKSGRLRAMGVSSAKRVPQLPDLPTISEAGVPGYEFSAWFGMLVPARTPGAIVQQLHGSVIRALHVPETATQFETQGAFAVGTTPAEFGVYIKREYESNARIVKSAGLKIE